LLYGTDTPHIKGLPEVPGLPLFGSLYELGTSHAKVAQGWAKKYGPVFQVRMGNRVSPSIYSRPRLQQGRNDD
jgi:phenylacetate 2-hydroxylase